MTYYRVVKWSAVTAVVLYLLLVLYIILWAASCWGCREGGNVRQDWILAVAIVYGPFSVALLWFAAFTAITAIYIALVLSRALVARLRRAP